MTPLRTTNERLPSYSAILLTISILLSSLKQDSPDITIIELFLVVIVPGVVGWLFLRIVLFRPSKIKAIAISHWALCLLLFFGWSMVNIIVAVVNGVSLLNFGRRVFPILSLPLIGLASTATFRSRQAIHIGYITLVIAGMVVTAESMVGTLNINLSTVESLQTIRQYGGGYYNAFGLSLVVPFFYRFRSFNSIQQTILVGAVGVFGGGLVLSFTRTYWVSTILALGVTGLIVFLNNRGEITSWLWWTLTVIVVLAVSILLIAPEQLVAFVLERVTSFSGVLSSRSVQDRLMELDGIVQSSMGNPLGILVGHGFGSEFTFYSVNPFSWSGTGVVQNEYSHNYYAYIYWTTGILGLAIYLLFWILFLRKIVGSIWNSNAFDTVYLLAIFSAITNMLIASLTAPPLMDLTWAIYFGIVLGIGRNTMKNLNEDMK